MIPSKNGTIGIVGYGAYVPKYYLNPQKLDERALSLGLEKKSLAQWDEDSVTMAVEAAMAALGSADILASQLGAVYVGSESPPYAVNPMSTIVADVLGVGKEYRAVDLQFACKAATAGIQMALGEVAGQFHTYALVVGTDKAQAKPGDVLEWSAGAGAGALVVGRERVLARMIDSTSISSDTPDFWRRAGQPFPQHGSRFTGEPAYFAHVGAAGKQLLEKTGLKPKEINYVVCHMPNGKFPVQASRLLGFKPEQYEPFLTVKEVANPYAASALIGLIAVLEQLKPQEKVLMVAYGSGAGADAILWEGTEEIGKRRWGGLGTLFKERVEIELADYRTRGRWQ